MMVMVVSKVVGVLRILPPHDKDAVLPEKAFHSIMVPHPPPDRVCGPFRAVNLTNQNENKMILEAVGTLFPAIPLAIAALNFRYTSLAGLMRNIFTQTEEVENCNGDKDILFRELRVLKTRMTLVKYSLFFAGVSFILNLFALFFSYHLMTNIASGFLAGTILALITSISCFCLETVLSTKALSLHISRADRKSFST